MSLTFKRVGSIDAQDILLGLLGKKRDEFKDFAGCRLEVDDKVVVEFGGEKKTFDLPEPAKPVISTLNRLERFDLDESEKQLKRRLDKFADEPEARIARDWTAKLFKEVREGREVEAKAKKEADAKARKEEAKRREERKKKAKKKEG